MCERLARVGYVINISKEMDVFAGVLEGALIKLIVVMLPFLLKK